MADAFIERYIRVSNQRQSVSTCIGRYAMRNFIHIAVEAEMKWQEKQLWCFLKMIPGWHFANWQKV